MERKIVRSSNIRAIGYDKATRALEIEFLDGGIYIYHNVPESIFQGIMKSTSKGKYFHIHIKDKFHFKKVR